MKLSIPWGFQVWWSQWHKFQSCMMICFWENTFWAKTSLFFIFRGPNTVNSEVVRSWCSQWYKFQSCMMICFWKTHFGLKHHFPLFRGPNSVHPEVFRCDDHNGTSFKAVWWSVSEKQNTFWAKTSLFFVFRGPNTVHSEVFRCDDHNGTSFKAVWWSISEKTHFGLKHHFSFVFRVPNSVYPEVFRSDDHSGTSFKAVWWSISEKKHILGITYHFSLYLEGQTLSALWGFQVWWSQWYKFQSCMMIHFWENTFWVKTSLFFVFRVPNSVYPEVFRCDDHNGTSFKAVWWSISEKTHFGLKSLFFVHFSLYLAVWAKLSALWGFQVWWSQWYKFQSCMMIHFWENTFWPKTSLSFVFRVPNSVYPEVFRCDDHSGTSFKAVWWTTSEKKTHILG